MKDGELLQRHWRLPKVPAIEITQIECHHDVVFGLAGEALLQRREGDRTAFDKAEPALIRSLLR